MRNSKRLMICYTSLLSLGLSFFMTDVNQWLFQLMFLVFLSIGFSMKELVKYQK